MNSQQLIDLENYYGAHNYNPLDVVISRGEGVWVYDVDGKKYLDCLSAYSALSHGHVHPKILKTLIEQASRLTLTSRAFRNDQLPLLYKELSELTGYEMTLPMNSGVEAVETAIKIARKWAVVKKGIGRDRPEIITFKGNFHGRTITAISFSTDALYRGDFGPFTPGFISVEYGNIQAVQEAITPNTAAILLEPIQGEAGVIVPAEGFLKEIRTVCDQENILFLADEIQTGLGRTGKLFACDHENVRPDIMIIGKALGGGFFPISAVLANRDILELLNPGEHGSTFGGNPLAAAVARTALRVLSDENLIENAATTGIYLKEQLEEIPSPFIHEIRGKGLLIGIELKKEAGGARQLCERLQSKNILVKDTHQNIIRITPPLVIDQETIDWAIPKIREVLLSKEII